MNNFKLKIWKFTIVKSLEKCNLPVLTWEETKKEIVFMYLQKWNLEFKKSHTQKITSQYWMVILPNI